MPSRFDTSFTVLGKELGLARIDLQAPEPNGAMGSGDYMRPSLWTRLVTLMNAPATSLLFRLWRRALRGCPLRLRRPGMDQAVVTVHRSNELIEEILPKLLLRGCRSEAHTSELQSLMRLSYAVFCLQ